MKDWLPVLELQHEHFFRHVNNAALARHGVEIVFKGVHTHLMSGRLYMRLLIGANFGGRREWYEVLDLPPTVFDGSPSAPTYRNISIPRRTVYAHMLQGPVLKARTLRNYRSSYHMADYLVAMWKPYKYKAVIDASDD